ncbi:2,3-bisphosphoglycerate-independent phosphoglycerate mutase [Novipirellula artificiosorum]|uniref:2,3-bisphosphoglycerate-independent phosphoglycerate mutase n=1 Tax=Novipirellula artificiosorum TaxID=2528016 RepID=A0A5C6E2V4_9BACT|nr:2,3-bisphosphoglycerate-independent phosphoglycerate mutase [Novipirellula artificiosorum]TWU42297.1 2,3-bisphosphoglycerate-independent phosphoglycerate mutase [Novipirellula artificiosorum]
MTQVRRKPVVLIIRDGWGQNPDSKWNDCNAVYLGKTPVADSLMAKYPHVLIATSGEDVGLPDGVMGNSEVGHQNIGAGRIVDQEVMRITRAIRDESFFANPVLLESIEHVKKTGGKLHLLGLMSDGRVHSDLDHAIAIVDLVKRHDLDSDRFAVHAITDGRDTSPTGGLEYVRQLEAAMKEKGVGYVATVMGRFYAMDRDLRWERVEACYKTMTQGSEATANSASEAIQNYYDHPTDSNRTGDEFIEPTSILHNGKPTVVADGDAVIFFNYRGDRTREITKAFTFDDEKWKNIDGGGFDRGKKLDDLYFATMTGYETGLPVQVIYEKRAKMPNILGEYVESLGLSQFRCAETEKYPHVTFFFNDYRDEPFSHEDREMAPSTRKVSTYDQAPEMSAHEITDKVLKEIESGEADLLIVNYANGDMVGHTGVLEAAIKAVETVDGCVGQVVEATLAKGGSLVVTADHGNCEQMIDPVTGGPHTAHTTYTVPLIVVEPGLEGKQLREGGRLADIAPTLLELMGLPVPKEMTGEALIKI